MKNVKTYLLIIKEDEKLRKRIYFVSLIGALFVLALVFKSPDFTGKFIVNDDGNVVGIHRNSLNKTEEYELILTIVDKESSETRDIKLKLSAVDANKDAAERTDKSDDKELETEAEINSILSNLELSKSKNLSLPSRLSTGTKLIWTVDNKDYSELIFISITYIVLVVLLIKSSVDAKHDYGKDTRRDIIRSLPRFTNQLMLMMNAGMILNDAFERICISYSLMKDSNQGYFEKKLIQIYENNLDHRTSTACLLSQFAAESRVKEFIRIATILSENERRGSDVIDNLSRESRYLWDEKKISARECGKLIDTKMSYPLGILLILLIVITMAPAILSM